MNNEALARAWDEGAKWAAVECGAIESESVAFLAPGDNPYRMPPADTCNRCGLPADRFSSFGEDYYRHADGTVHERVY